MGIHNQRVSLLMDDLATETGAKDRYTDAENNTLATALVMQCGWLQL
jgi:hypothetical protein